MSRYEPLRLRIYGESITLRRNQWEELLDDMRPDCDNARRIRELLGPVRYGSESNHRQGGDRGSAPEYPRRFRPVSDWLYRDGLKAEKNERFYG